MSASPPPEHDDPLVQESRLRSERHRKSQAEGEPSVGRRLAQIGVLGWMIVTPTLLGVFLGRWLDGKFSSGVFCTAPLLLAGLGLGCWSSWKWMKST
ncbi:MAG: AtpZ/AtpI family protein [Variovorax sp.]|nr:AtpZ/AtpI family protein [Variovorax sp.]